MVMCAVSVDARLNVNVALNCPSYQVTAYQDTYHAGYANDGNHDTDLINGPCMHTRSATNPWWAVDQGVTLHVRGVKFTNRDTSSMYAVSSGTIKCEPILLTI